jgi:hypothetical protein
MVRVLDELGQRAVHDNKYVGDGPSRQLRDRLAQLSAGADRFQVWLTTYQLAKVELYQGHLGESLRLYGQAEQMLSDSDLGPRLLPRMVSSFLFDVAVAHLRSGETENCCRQHNADSCLLPIRSGGIHSRPEGSRQAIQYLVRVLERTQPTERLHLAAVWLLNVAYMTIGGYPQDVPTAWRIPPESFESEADFPELVDVATQAGVATFSLAGGAIADDFDQDGFLDLVVSTYDPRGQIRVFWNNGDGTFADGTAESGLPGIFGGLNLIQTDYDNDGQLDIYVMRGGWLAAGGRHPNSLLRNLGNRTFVDVTFAAGLGRTHYPSQTAGWADYDLDGDLDLYVGNEAARDLPAPCQLFRNNGNGTFTDLAAPAGVTNDRLAKAVIWGDYDADGDPDLYVSNFGDANRLYQNRGDGTFQDVAPQLGVSEPRSSFPAWFWDVNNDGALDLFVSAYVGGVAELAGYFRGQLPGAQGQRHRLYLGDRQGGFQEAGGQWNLLRPSHPMGANFGDIDNDGFLDFYLGTGWPEYHELTPNVLYRNQAGERFLDITPAARVGHLQKGHAVVFADLDDDGDQDLFEQVGGFVPGDRYFDTLYRNPGSGHHWVTVQLVGTTSNRPAIGARIHVRVAAESGPRSIYRHVNSGGSFGANPLRQTIGLAAATRIDELEVSWPGTGRMERFHDLPVDCHLRIVEGSGTCEVVGQPRTSPGG